MNPNNSSSQNRNTLEYSDQMLEDDDILEEDEDEDEYVDLADAVEVQVDDTNVPMDEDDLEEDELLDAAEDHRRISSTHRESVPDMSVHTFTSHQPSAAYAVACHTLCTTSTSPRAAAAANGLVIVSGGGDDKAYLHYLAFSYPLPQQALTIPLSHTHKDSVSCVATNVHFLDTDINNKPYVAVGSYDGSILIYDPNLMMTQGANIAPMLAFDGPTDVEFLAFHPKGGSVLLAGSIADGTVWMFHIPTKKCLQVFVGHECHSSSGDGGGVTAGCFTPDGKFALSVGMDGTMRLWAPRTGQCKHVFQLHPNNNNSLEGGGSGLLCLAVDGGMDSQLAIAGSENGLAFVVHLASKKLVATLRHVDTQKNSTNGQVYSSSVEAVAFASRAMNPHWVATGGSDGILKIWDLTHGDGSGQCRQTCHVSSSDTWDMSLNEADRGGGGDNVFGITRITWHPTVPMVICSYTDGYIRFWDARNGQLLRSLCGGRSQAMSEDDMQVNDMAIAMNTIDDTIWITSAHDNGAVKVFHVQTQDLLKI